MADALWFAMAADALHGGPPSLDARSFAWELWGLRALLVVVAVGLIVGIFYLREWRHRSLQHRLARQVRERTRELARERDVVAAQARKLAELDALKSDLFANVSHEFRTPLTLALGPLKDLEAGAHGPLPVAVAAQVRLVRRNAERILALVEEMLDTTRAEAGRFEIRARPIDLSVQLAELRERFAGLAERRGIELRFDPGVDRVEIWGDPAQLEKVFANLLSNALRHTMPDGTVELTLEPPVADGTVTVTVRDDGEGIPEKELELIFDRFYRVKQALANGDGGTGLGLPLARQLTELHGGSLTVESEVGMGSVFRVVLALGRGHFSPAQLAAGESAAAAEEASAGLVPAPPLGRGWQDAASEPLEKLLDDRVTVLVVDDHPDIRGYVRRHLEARCRVLEAANGAEGYRLARRSPPDLVLTDLMMPVMDGMALCRALKGDPELDYVPVVLLTAKESGESKLEALGAGADDYLTKPFEVGELVARVDNLIRQRRRLRERFGSGHELPPPFALHTRADLGVDDRALLERVRKALAEGLGDEDFNVASLASRLALDRSQLYRRLKDIIGSTPSELILETRLCRAAELLARGEGGVGEVAVAVGFKSVAHFSERFRRRFGTTPSAWRGRPQPVRRRVG